MTEPDYSYPNPEKFIMSQPAAGSDPLLQSLNETYLPYFIETPQFKDAEPKSIYYQNSHTHILNHHKTAQYLGAIIAPETYYETKTPMSHFLHIDPTKHVYQGSTTTVKESFFESVAIEPTPILGQPHPAKLELSRSFRNTLANVDFADVAVRMRKSKPIVDAEGFRFVPLTRMDRRSPGSLLLQDVHIPADVQATYNDIDGKPYLDTAQAIGLVYNNWLVAVGGAEVDHTGQLVVKQLQDVTNVRKTNNPELFARTGLRNGFWWRDTLVTAWERIAERIGAERVVIQSNENNRYSRVKNAEGRGYNDVARRMHYEFDEASGNWVK